jgi:DivIVA domain-containing protein
LALDRQSIARRDFPAARRGYDPAAVDRHLAAVADEVEELRRRSSPGTALAGQTSEQVRTIIEAAEASAAGIRESATVEARGHVARVAEAADALRERIAALDRELTDVLGALRGGAERIRADLAALAADTTGLAAASSGAVPGAEPVAGAAVVAPSALGATVGAAAAAATEPEEVGEEPALAAMDETAGAAADRRDTEPAVAASEPAAPVGRSTDEAGARIVALQWAMDGRPRAETDAYLAEHYDLPDRAGLLEQVYAIASKG